MYHILFYFKRLKILKKFNTIPSWTRTNSLVITLKFRH